MSNQSDIKNLIKAVSGQANILTIPRLYLALVKSHRAALLLSQCVYWSDRTKDPEGWFYKTYTEWKKELFLNQHAIETALKNLPWIETKVDRVNRTNKVHYRVRMEELTQALIDLAGSANPDLAGSANPDLAGSANPDLAENYKSSIAEINNPEITSKPARKNGARPTSLSGVSTTREIQDRYCELLGRKPDDWSAGEAKAAQKISMAYSPDQLAQAYQHYKSQPFWNDKRLTLRYLSQQMPEFFSRPLDPLDKFILEHEAANGNGN